MNNLKETTLHSYSFGEGFSLLGSKSMVGNGKSLDWNGVKSFIEENKDLITSVHGGLSEDWSCTCDEIWNIEEGFIEDNNVWSSSRWATPAIEVEYKDGTTKVYEMYVDGMNG